ncbi:MAG: GNAT family N-acetyltransferase [Gemmatimonadaceae bacterium]|nr:GNAT family N-acetyltransferase [Gemmatimonadaceae bacterium]
MTDIPAAITLRAPRPGDLGWVVSRHGALYAEEYGWNMDFEVLVARVAADFFATNDPSCERCWIAERTTSTGTERVGSVFLVRHPDRAGVAKLRMLLIDPSARGLGLGKRLVEECTTFARAAGYHTITLWTNSILTTARAIYQRAGYQLVQSAPEPNFGKDLVGETWELTL